jgi:hypothetical protein
MKRVPYLVLAAAGSLAAILAVAYWQVVRPARMPAASEAMARILLDYPNARVLVSTPCGIGEDQVESLGVLIQTSSLHAVVAYRSRAGWKTTEVPRKIENSRGSDMNFLGDFQNRAGTFIGPFEIRCASPRTDSDITPKASGEFVGRFAETFAPEVKHLCFQASKPYNSWHCLSINRATGVPETSFVQMVAD